MYLARKHTDLSFPEIRRFMGKKDHSTVILAERRIKRHLEADAMVRWITPAGQREDKIAELVSELEAQLERGNGSAQ